MAESPYETMRAEVSGSQLAGVSRCSSKAREWMDVFGICKGSFCLHCSSRGLLDYGTPQSLVMSLSFYHVVVLRRARAYAEEEMLAGTMWETLLCGYACQYV